MLRTAPTLTPDPCSGPAGRLGLPVAHREAGAQRVGSSPSLHKSAKLRGRPACPIPPVLCASQSPTRFEIPAVPIRLQRMHSEYTPFITPSPFYLRNSSFMPCVYVLPLGTIKMLFKNPFYEPEECLISECHVVAKESFIFTPDERKLCLNLSLCCDSSSVLKITCLKMTHCRGSCVLPTQAGTHSHWTPGGTFFFRNFPFMAAPFPP